LGDAAEFERRIAANIAKLPGLLSKKERLTEPSRAFQIETSQV
jgi:hypothetical protein